MPYSLRVAVCVCVMSQRGSLGNIGRKELYVTVSCTGIRNVCGADGLKILFCY
jgi:hypothetical protein